jgi:hypothetical protein
VYKFNILTLDLETKITLKTDPKIEEIFEVVSCAWYDGVNSICKHILDYNMDYDNLFSDIFSSLFIPKNHNKTVYVHNFSKFDGIFLVERLAHLVPEDRLSSDFSLIKRKDNIICLTVTLCGVTLHFKDSYLLLNSSLAKLAQGFNVTRKGEFDFTLNNTLQGLIDNKEELMEYNIRDCVVLYEILEIFSKEVFELFKLNIARFSTLPGLAFAIFRSNYMKKSSNIPITSYKIYRDLVQGYTGGHVDVFKPSNPDIVERSAAEGNLNISSKKSTLVYTYDVNSLYPSEMAKQYYPVGTPTYVELTSDLGFVSNTYFKNKNRFGFYYVDVIAPDHLGANPLLLKSR